MTERTSSYNVRKNGVVELNDQTVDAIISSIRQYNGMNCIVNMVTMLNQEYFYWDIHRARHWNPNVKVDVLEITYIAKVG